MASIRVTRGILVRICLSLLPGVQFMYGIGGEGRADIQRAYSLLFWVGKVVHRRLHGG